jgi:23S rRNA pseudouridine1911/1915/1917 synthase
MSGIDYSAKELDALVLFADNHLLAVNKPAGLLTQDSGTGLRNLEDWAREWVRVEKSKPGAVFLNAVHRIDRAVSGVVLFARTSKALSRLNEDIRKRDCRKIYHALVEGVPEQSAGKLVHWLSHEHHRAEVCGEGDKGARQAVLRYRTLKTLDGFSLLEIDLETGRYHQIRAQLSAIGCPILGDEKYGAKQTSKSGEIALHHARLEVVHPTLKQPVIIEAPYPVHSSWWNLI